MIKQVNVKELYKWKFTLYSAVNQLLVYINIY